MNLREQIVDIIADTCHFAVEDGKCTEFDKCSKCKCFFAQEQADRIIALLKSSMPKLELKRFYVCGSEGYVEGYKRGLDEQLGVDQQVLEGWLKEGE